MPIIWKKTFDPNKANNVSTVIGKGCFKPINPNINGANTSQLLIEAHAIIEYWFFFLKKKLIMAPKKMAAKTINAVC